MWERIKIKYVKPHRSYPRLPKDDRVTVSVEMPIEVYSEFRRQIEAPSSFNNRRGITGFDMILCEKTNKIAGDTCTNKE